MKLGKSNYPDEYSGWKIELKMNECNLDKSGQRWNENIYAAVVCF